ncbi:MAG: hypothetical protein R2854_16290 [Caldilineaceae bacterium]
MRHADHLQHHRAVRCASVHRGLHGRPRSIAPSRNGTHRRVRGHGHLPLGRTSAQRRRLRRHGRAGGALQNSSGPAVVVFQDIDDPTVAATFGEVMCTTYKAFGAGTHHQRRGPHLDQVRAIDFPVFTNGTICSHGYNHIPEVMVPVHVGGLFLYPDDMLHADVNGVSTIPKEIAADVADVGAEFVAAEMVVIDAMQAPNPTIAQMKDAR